jgi:hypothetical protein
VVPPGVLDYLVAYPTGQALPPTSNLNAVSGQIISNAAIVGAGTNGSVALWPSNATDAIIDINGYFNTSP